MNIIKRSFGDTAKGLWVLFRAMPVMTYTGSIVFINFAFAWHRKGTDILMPALFLFLGGFAINGLLAHSLNDIEDWRSGTDRVSPGILSGGSKVLKRGLLSESDLRKTAVFAAIVCLVLAIYFYMLRGPLVPAALAIGLFLTWAYTNPPLRLAYIPFLGEWAGLWFSGVLLSTASYFVLTGGFDRVPFFAGVVQSTLVLGWLMQHHIPDVMADLSAVPRKLTTPAYFHLKWGSGFTKVPSILYFTLALVLSIIGTIYISPVLMWMIPVALAGILAAASTRVSDIKDVTCKQLFTTALIIINSISFALLIFS